MLCIYPKLHSYLKYPFSYDNQNEASWRIGEIILKPSLCTYFTPLLFCVSRLVIKRVEEHVGLLCNHLDLVCNTLESHSWENARTVIICIGLYIIDAGLAHHSTLICQVNPIFKTCPGHLLSTSPLRDPFSPVAYENTVVLYKIRINYCQYILFRLLEMFR
jgi:hypothetical protein